MFWVQRCFVAPHAPMKLRIYVIIANWRARSGVSGRTGKQRKI